VRAVDPGAVTVTGSSLRLCHDASVSTLVRHLNCATMRPPAARLGIMPGHLVAHCLLVEGADGLTLVDTGIGAGDVADPGRLGAPFVKAVGARLDLAETAVAQVQALGYRPADVRDIVLTHLDLDHAGGLGDFPHARVHVHADELAAARARRHPKEKGRYIAAQWAHGPDWVEHPSVGGDGWFGFEAIRAVGEDVLLVPLRGHTRGHSAVAVRRPSGGWFLHAGDGYFFHGELQRPASCPSGLRAFQTLVQMDKRARLANQDRLRALHADHHDEVAVFSAHDATEYDALAALTH
jgi:glyoxylase-like metal-dependent hydrolase (beta-lactamase superfamily II)